jgi:hypothetical protein
MAEMIHNAASELRTQQHTRAAASFLKRLFGGSMQTSPESATTPTPPPSKPVPTERVSLPVNADLRLGSLVGCLAPHRFTAQNHFSRI